MLGTFNSIEELHQFIDQNLGLGISYWKQRWTKGFSYHEALTIIWLALREAAIRWNPKKSKYSTYSWFWLRKFFNAEYSARTKNNKLIFDSNLTGKLLQNKDDNCHDKNALRIHFAEIREMLLNSGLLEDEWRLLEDKYVKGLKPHQLALKWDGHWDVGINYKINSIIKKIKNILGEQHYEI